MQQIKKDLLNEYKDAKDIRLNRFLSDAGICSRREADRLIEQGKIFVNGRKAVIGERITEADHVTIDGKQIVKNQKLILLAFNKPRGIVCTAEKREKDNIIDYLHYPERIYPIGRLDKDSEGLILLTNDGSLVNHILKASNYHEKEYIVTVNKKIDHSFIRQMSEGIPLEEMITRPCIVKKINEYTFSIILTQGLNRQIRRMCQYLGYKVTKLKRIRVMNIKLEQLEIGKYRHVSTDEIEQLKKEMIKGKRMTGKKNGK